MKILKKLLFILFATLSINATVYENAEDGSTSSWHIYDSTPAGATITNLTENGNHFIKLKGTGVENGFILGNFENRADAWKNTTERLLSWKMKTDKEFFIYIRVNTNHGNMYIYYDTNSTDSINRTPYVHNQLDSNASNGTWQTFTRNLNQDIDPSGNIQIKEINGFLVRSSDISLDDISLDIAPVVDTTPPTLTLNGDNPKFITLNSNYIEDGAIAIDNIDGNITQNINISGNVNTSSIGDYIRTYSISDSSGNYAEINRTIKIINTTESNDTNITIYEDAEDGTTSRWRIYDNTPSGVTINNILDGNNRVIKLTGTLTQNGFMLGNYENRAGAWNNTEQKVISWRMRTSESFYIFVRVSTSDGDKYIYYDENPSDTINSSFYIHQYLGNNISDGSWKTITRNLAQDLDPSGTTTITAVNAFLVRSPNILLDDIKMSNLQNSNTDLTPPVLTLNGDNPKTIAINSSYIEEGATAIDNVDGNITQDINISGSVDTSVAGNYTITYSVSDSSGNYAETSRTVNVTDVNNSDINDTNITIYEDAEDGTTSRWRIYDNTPSGVTINNILDGNNRVIKLTGTLTQNGFMLGNYENRAGAWNNTEQKVISWRMRTSESFYIFVRVSTSDGDKYIYYDENPSDTINSSFYIHQYLGNNISDGSWKTITRNLAQDLDPSGTTTITAVNAFLVRSPNILLDDIKMSNLQNSNTDLTPPVLTLNGDNPKTIAINSSYIEEGATAIDNVDGNITQDINISGSVDTSVAGNYTITYSVSDSSGNYAETSRTVNVVDPSLGQIYEDAEDGSISRWRIYDNSPSGATIQNIIDNGNHVIHLQGTNLDNGFILGALEYEEFSWNNPQGTILSWDMKTDKPFSIFVRINTSEGHKYLYYDENSYDSFNSDAYIHHQLENNISNGTWKTVVRDLAQDLDSTGAIKIIEVHAFLVRASDILIDNVTLKDKYPELAPPILKLNGANPLVLTKDSPYVERNATAIDHIDGNLTDTINITGDVNTSQLGTYTVHYSVVDSDNNLAEVNRTVQVVTAPTLDSNITLLLEEAANGSREGVNYIVVGDSTRQHALNDDLIYYTNQLNKINVNFLHTARSGLKAKYWLDGTSQRVTISDTLALIPDENQSNFILEFCLGINDFGIGGTSEVVYNTIKNSINALRTARPNMKILLVSPVAHNYPGIPNTSENLESIYLKIASEENLSLVSARKALIEVQQNFTAPDKFNSDFYIDRIHPNSDGLKRLINYIFSEIGGSNVHQYMTVTDTPTKTLDELHVGLQIDLTPE